MDRKEFKNILMIVEVEIFSYVNGFLFDFYARHSLKKRIILVKYITTGT